MVGIVKSVDGPVAKVIVEAGADCCDQCRKKDDACDISVKGVETEAVNLAHAKAGQKVNVDMKTVTYLKGALIIYILPVLALFFGAILGLDYLPAYFSNTDPNVLSAEAGFLLFLVALFFVRILAGRMEKKTEHKSVISSVIED